MDRWTRGPTDTGERIDQGAPLNAEGPTDGGLGGAAIKRGDDGGQFLRIDCYRPSAAAPSSPSGGQTSIDALLGQRALELRQGAEHME
jgi:hypothetical protein